MLTPIEDMTLAEIQAELRSYQPQTASSVITDESSGRGGRRFGGGLMNWCGHHHERLAWCAKPACRMAVLSAPPPFGDLGTERVMLLDRPPCAREVLRDG
jgi:hypothetical protein